MSFLQDAIKKAASRINQNGEKSLYPDGYTAWWSDLSMSNKAIVSEKGAREYYKTHPHPDYNSMSFKEGWKLSQKESKIINRWYYDNMVDPSVRESYERKANLKKNQIAAGVSLAGSTVSAIPHPIAKGVGTVLTIPDQIYDWSAAIDSPSVSNSAHVLVDYPELVGKIIPGEVDDYILKGLNAVSNIDDAASGAEFDMFGFMNRQSANKPQREAPTAQVESTKVVKPFTIIPLKRIGGSIESGKSGIHIKPENKGKFTETKKRTGKTTEELTHSKNPLTRKRAIFAQNAKKWKH